MFDAVVIGAGMFGAYCAEKVYRNADLPARPDAGTSSCPSMFRIWLAIGPTPALEQPRSWSEESRLGLTVAKPGGISRSRLLPGRTIALLGRLVTSADRC